jgi:hypothetical protein
MTRGGPRGGHRAGPAQHEDRGRAAGRQPAGDPRRGPPPGPAAPRGPASPPRRLGRESIHGSSRRGDRGRGHRGRNEPPGRDRPGHRIGLDETQLGQQAAGAGPAARFLGQAAADQPPQFAGQVAQLGRAVDQPVHQQGARPGTERPVPGSGVHQHRAQAEDVARGSDVLAQGLFRRHESRRGEVSTGGRGPRDREVGDPRPALGQQYVGRIDVPVHQARGMQRTQAFRQPGRQRPHGTDRYRPAVADRLDQRRPGDVRRRQPGHRGLQVRVRHGRECSADLPGRGDLGPEPRIDGHVGPHGGQRDVFPARRTAQEQAAVAQLPEQPVRPDRAWRVRHQWRYHPDPHSRWRLEPFLPLCQVMRSYGAFARLYTDAPSRTDRPRRAQCPRSCWSAPCEVTRRDP